MKNFFSKRLAKLNEGHMELVKRPNEAHALGNGIFDRYRYPVLTAAHALAQFSCGKPSLDRWLKTRALSNQEKGFTAVLVVHEANRVIGYYGLAPTGIVPSILPRSIRTGQPRRA